MGQYAALGSGRNGQPAPYAGRIPAPRLTSALMLLYQVTGPCDESATPIHDPLVVDLQL